MPCCRHASSRVAPSGTRTAWPSIVTSTSRRGASRNTSLIAVPPRSPPGRPQSASSLLARRKLLARQARRRRAPPARSRWPPPVLAAIWPPDQAELYRRGGGGDRRLAEPADGGVPHDRRDVVEQGELSPGRAERGPARQPAEQFLLADRPDPAGHALAAGLVPEEPRDPPQQRGHVGGVVENQDDAGSQRRADGPHPLERERGVERVRTDERTRRAAEQHRAQRPPAAHPARRLDHLAQRDPEFVLVQAGLRDAAGQAEQPGSGGGLRADPRERGPADPQDLQHAEQCLHVVNRGWLAEQADLSGERRLVARLGALPLDRVDQ